jgi:hypothetical protein
MAFFALAMINDSIENYYRLNTKLMMRFGIDFDTLEMMFPFERDVYYHLIIEELEKKKRDAAAS